MWLTRRWGACGVAAAVVSVAGAGPANGAAGTAYRGRSSQQQTVSFSISNQVMRNFRIVVLETCPDKHILRYGVRISMMKLRDGRFGGRFVPRHRHHGEQATVHGRVSARHVTGTIKEVGFSTREHALCHGSARFSARRV